MEIFHFMTVYSKQLHALSYQVDIGRPYRLRFIATQGLYRGSNYSAWIEQYTLDFRGEHSSWFPYTESGSVKVGPKFL